MTRPVVSPDELHSLEFADPRTHAERELTEACPHPRAERPCHRQSPRADRLGCQVLSHYADAMPVYRDEEHVTTERGAEPFPDPDRLTPDDRPDPHPASGFGAHMRTAEQTGPEQRTHPGVRYGMSTLPVARTPEGR
ncbi:hypothetical protein [Streptomyces sp. NPDC086519]|uniref:hypothetical protein n=1 Tax=Streptomyces sp. NPDC086519 TaxID=3154863 RepID=UPI00343AC790